MPVVSAPTSPPRNAQEKWSDTKSDCTFQRARVDLPRPELDSIQSTGRAMSNDCWLRPETTRIERAAHSRVVSDTSNEPGSTRRDPRRTTTGSRHRTTIRHGRSTQSASAMGGFVATSRRSQGHDGTLHRPVWHSASVAPFGVSAISRLAHIKEARESRRDDTYEVQETDGVCADVFRAPHATAGDGCPGVVSMNQTARSSQRGKG